jgi:anti-anti-sigma factor
MPVGSKSFGSREVWIRKALQTFRPSYWGSSSRGRPKIVVSFEKPVFISSAGLRALLMAAKQLKGSGELRICSLNEVVQDVFDVSGFNMILTVRETEREALESLR